MDNLNVNSCIVEKKSKEIKETARHHERKGVYSCDMQYTEMEQIVRFCVFEE